MSPILEREKLLEELAWLDNIGRNLAKLVTQHRLGPIYERKEQISALASQLLLGGESVILLGEPGVEENAVVK